MSKSNGGKIKISSVAPAKNLHSEEGWNKMKLRWLIDESTVGSRDGVLGHTVFPPGARHDAHVHENAEEYIIVVKGKASHLQGEDTFEVKAGEVVYVPRGVVHATRNASKTRNLELFFIYAGAPSLEKTSYRRA